MQIRRLVPSDAMAYRALMLEAYTLAPESYTSTVAERVEQPLGWWAARMADTPQAHELVIGAFVDGQLAGAAGLAFEQRERTRHKSTLFGMYVRPPARRAGLARAIVHEVLQQARQVPPTVLVQLTVTASNEDAVRLYADCGFVPFGTEPLAVRLGDRYIAKTHMWRPLAEPAA
jgi:GNAT superfamily N-acetyltransferase